MSRIIGYILLAATLFSCSGEKGGIYTISGNVSNGESTLYIFGEDNLYERIDSIKSDNAGKFTFTIETDTVTPLLLALPDGSIVPVYAEPGIEATIKKDKHTNTGWHVEGGVTQALHDSISRELHSAKSDKNIAKIVDQFIEEYPASEVNTDIMRRYIIDIEKPKVENIRMKISELGGAMQDKEFFARAKKYVSHQRSNIKSRSFPSFSYTTADGRQVALKDYPRRYILVTFWSSWDKPSRSAMRHLKEIEEKTDSAYFSILNISFDNDTLQWKECIKTDSIVGDNVCEPNAWNSALANEFLIPSLPFSMLLTPYHRVHEYGLELNEAAEYIDSLVNKFRKQEKEKELKKKKDKK